LISDPRRNGELEELSALPKLWGMSLRSFIFSRGLTASFAKTRSCGFVPSLSSALLQRWPVQGFPVFDAAKCI
jgi:hypothetical protein